ncbi:MAG: HPr family phosphocarrier protein [Pyrinomonadaceae bacterium]
MVERLVTITNRLGLHARAAAKLVRLAESFASSIQLEREDGSATADAKSILGVLMLAASRSGSLLRVIADGPDEAAALDAITAIFAEGFGENV